ncbi:hypothetical protein VTN96DRAFT_4339 [Rasamsonia emersonii]
MCSRCVNGYKAIDDRNLCTLSRLSAPICRILGSNSSRQRQLYHSSVNFHQTSFSQQSSKSWAHTQILQILQRSYVFTTPLPQRVLVSYRPVIGLDVEIYFNHLNPAATFRDSGLYSTN